VHRGGAVRRLHRRPLAIPRPLLLLPVGPEPTVDPEHVLTTPLVGRVCDDRLVDQPPHPPAAVLAVGHQAPQPRPGPPENPLRPLDEGGAMPLLVLVGGRDDAGQGQDPLVVHRYVELVAEVEAPATPPDPGVWVGEPSATDPWVACAPGLDKAGVEDGVHHLDPVPLEDVDDLLFYHPLELLYYEQGSESAEDGSGVATLPILYEAEPPDPLVGVKRPRELPEASHLLHAHHYEGPEEAEGVPEWPSGALCVKAFPRPFFGNA